jgi:Multicopper oxidase
MKRSILTLISGTALLVASLVVPASAVALPRVASVDVGAQNGALTKGTAGSATYQVTVTKATTQALTATLSVTTALPAGVTASFSPASLSWLSSESGAKTSTLTLATGTTTPNGVTAFTVRAVRSNGGNGSDLATGAGTLTVDLPVPTITFGPAPAPMYPGGSFSVSATTSSDGNLTFSAAGGPCVLLDGVLGTFSPTSLGTCAVLASTPATANWAAGAAYLYVVITPIPNVFLDLYAVTGTASLPGQSVPIWAYTSDGSTATTPGGPTLGVAEGDVVQITLHNDITEQTALVIQGQNMIPDVTGAAPGGNAAYVFHATKAGTFLYQAGLLSNAEHQVAMGLYGALIVRSATAGQAYDNAATAYDDEAVIVTSEIDPQLNASANPSGFDMRAYAPRYFLVNGKAYPDTDTIPTMAGHRILLRYVNAGVWHHSMATLGLSQLVIADDGNLLAYSHRMVAETIGPGQTLDTIATIPASAADGTRYALYDGNQWFSNSGSAAFGGMLAFLEAGTPPPPGPDTVGPAVSSLTLTPSVTTGAGDVTVTATVSDVASGGSNIAAAEYYIDTTGGSPTAMTGAFASPTESVSGTISAATLSGLTSGSHTIYVRGQDTVGNWGGFNFAVLVLDKAGPATTGAILSPNHANGTTSVAITATATDLASGGSNIAGAEYSIDGGAPAVLSVSAAAPIAAVSGTISAATVNLLTEGSHSVAIRSQDALGNWGPATVVTLVVDKSGPATSNVTAAPNPNNGTLGINSSNLAVRVSATFTDTGSNISTAEGFIDAVGANGTGFAFTSADGQFNSMTESGYADIPLTTIAQLSTDNHTIYVHGKDAAGNWGATSSTILVVDKAAPTITTVTLVPTTLAFGPGSTQLTVSAADVGTGVVGGEYWIDAAAPTSFAGTTVTINTGTLAAGAHTVNVRVQDAATNWSAVSSATLYLVRAVNDAVAITANTSATQTADVNAAAGALANDQPVGVAGRTARLASAPQRTSGSGAGTITVTCPASLGTAAAPAISGNTVCTNGAYRVTLTGVGNNNNQRRASKQGTFSFTYTETLNGVTSVATVVITVN